MASTCEILVSGTVRLTAKANQRGGAPSLSAPVQRKLDTGSQVTVLAITAGDAVSGNPLWFRLDGQSYVWSGACSDLLPLAATAPATAAAAAAISAPGASAVVAAKPFTTMVVDLYHGDQVVSFAEAFAAGVRGIIHKATTGASGRDDAYQRRRQTALDAGMLWGAYHWGTAAPVKDQVDNFLQSAAPDDRTLVALDYERDVGNQMTLQGARDFLDEISQRLGRKAVLYSGSTLKQALGDTKDAFLASHRLWLCQYGPRAVVQASWPPGGYWLWQYTSGSTGDPRYTPVPGIPGNASGEVDCNCYNGTPEDLAAQWAS